MNENITPLPLPLKIKWKDGLDMAVLHDRGGYWIANIEATREDIGNLVSVTNAYPALTARVKALEEALQETLDVMEMQEGREQGFLHIRQPSAKTAWDDAKTKARAALNKEPTHESRCICNDAPPIHKIPGESFDDEAMRHYENLDHYREHCPLHGRFVNKEPTT